MLSLLTNVSALSALQALNRTDGDLGRLQSELSTGKRVDTAADGASDWSIATTMSSNAGALGAVVTALGESAAMVDATSSALTSVIDAMSKMKDDLVLALQPGSDNAKVDADLAAQQSRIVAAASSASFNGQNWLDFDNSTTVAGPDLSAWFAKYGDAGFVNNPDGSMQLASLPDPSSHPEDPVSLVASYDAADGVSSITFDRNDVQLLSSAPGIGRYQGLLAWPDTLTRTPVARRDGSGYLSGGTPVYESSILTFSVASAPADDIRAMLASLEDKLGAVTNIAAQMGTTRDEISTQQSFVGTLRDAMQAGVGAFVDADMNEVSTRLSALQVQRQLGIQALGIANADSRSILRLFQ